MAPILNIEEKIKFRPVYNTAILGELEEFFQENPDIRFGQALIILGICEDVGNVFSEESADTYTKLVSKLKNQINK